MSDIFQATIGDALERSGRVDEPMDMVAWRAMVVGAYATLSLVVAGYEPRDIRDSIASFARSLDIIEEEDAEDDDGEGDEP